MEELAPQLHEAIAMARVVDEHRHGDEIGERRAGALERAVHQREHGAHLLVELAADVAPIEVGGGRLAGEPHGAAAFGDDGGRESAALLVLGAFEMLDLRGHGSSVG